MQVMVNLKAERPLISFVWLFSCSHYPCPLLKFEGLKVEEQATAFCKQAEHYLSDIRVKRCSFHRSVSALLQNKGPLIPVTFSSIQAPRNIMSPAFDAP